MQQREKILAAVAGSAILLWLGLPAVHGILFAPVEEQRSALADIDGELTDRLTEVAEIERAGLLLKEWRGRSLPPDAIDAQRLYLGWLTDLAQMSGFNDLKVTPGRRIPNAKVYTSVLFSLEGTAKYSQLKQFLFFFSRVDLAHRINQMKIEPAESRGDPAFDVAMTIEGMCVTGAEARPYLLPQASLKEGFRSSTDSRQIAMEDVSDFPDETPFLIQIGHEFLQVTAVQDAGWTVVGGRDATATARHEAGDVVQLVPIRQAADRERGGDLPNPFIKPAPRIESPVRTPPPVVAVRDVSASETYLAACITTDDTSQAWLYRSSNQKKVVVRQGEVVDIGGIRATVVDIQKHLVVLQNDEGHWQLRIGDYWGDMTKLPADVSTSALGTGQSE